MLQMAQVFVSKSGSNIGCHVAQIFIDIHSIGSFPRVFCVSLCPYAKEAGESNPHFLDFFRKVCENLFQAVTDSRLRHTFFRCNIHVGHVAIELFIDGVSLQVSQCGKCCLEPVQLFGMLLLIDGGKHLLQWVCSCVA